MIGLEIPGIPHATSLRSLRAPLHAGYIFKKIPYSISPVLNCKGQALILAAYHFQVLHHS
jgi:hypothetical protein